MSLKNKIQNDPTISDNDKYYFFYMYDLGTDIIVPLLTEKGLFRPGYSVAEIGSAEGGVLMAFAEKGAKDLLATDIAVSRLEKGEEIAQKAGLEINFTSHDVIYEEPLEKWKNTFDLVLLRDVIEHLDDPYIALKNIKKIIKSGGHLYVTFPPYPSPFGGHQHTLGSKLGKIPYIHLLPSKIFSKLISTGRPQDIVEVERLIDIKLTTGKFEKAANKAGFEIVGKDYYLLRPVFKMKFNLPTLGLGPLKYIPGFKNLISTEAAYTLKA
ncbi:MAG: class I SAM-dependent methyltransferase [Candidatus Kapaibacteriales bacterium]